MADEVAPSGLTLALSPPASVCANRRGTSMSPASTSSSTASRRAPRANWPTCSAVPPCQCRGAAARQRALRAPGAGPAPTLGRLDEGGGRRRIGRVADQDERRDPLQHASAPSPAPVPSSPGRSDRRWTVDPRLASVRREPGGVARDRCCDQGSPTSGRRRTRRGGPAFPVV
jgi:hypothetical protein